MNRTIQINGPSQTLKVRCHGTITAFELSDFAGRWWGVDPKSVTVQVVFEEAPSVDLELRWVGDDYTHGGTPSARRLQLRRPNDKKWRDVQ